MSRIAAWIVIAAVAAPASAKPLTAQQVLARHRAATSIGPDPCKAASGDEIVVCGQRESPYALPLYDPSDGDDASQYGGNRVRQMAAIKESDSACAKQGAFCYPPPLFNGGSVLRVLIKGVKALTDGE